uniref:Vacuolar import/degradation Vid27 C-terminal domain-containing protein n=1 Tax=Ananas comosus var. bracteatus TaxID=296719 RepID=A0A6V7P4J2_ANACO|nr:unnamed protein product [Ananas comosus var. bracteatus]
MGGSHSREGLELSDAEEEDEEEEEEEDEEEHEQREGSQTLTAPSLDDVDCKLRSLKLKYSSNPSPSPSPSSSSQNANPNPNPNDAVKLYLHIGGSSPTARWIVSDKRASYSFLKPSPLPDPADDSSSPWFLVIGSKVRAKVGAEMQLKPFPEQRRVDFVADGSRYRSCLFENTYGLAATEENRARVFGKDFVAWAQPEVADDAIWENAEESFEKSPILPVRASQDLLEEFEEEAIDGGIQSLALGALDNSFLVNNSGIQIVRNFNHGVHGKGVSVKISHDGGQIAGSSTPKKALLMRAESNMLLMSPGQAGKPHSTGVYQLDIETGKVVTEWKFEKDGLCRWDMRDRSGMVQNIASSNESPVLHWTQGHQFSRGTNFQCFASTGDGSIVVGSIDGKIRLYSKNSMRMAKTAFPGLGSPITHVDVTFDGKWILDCGSKIAEAYSTGFASGWKDNKFHGGQFSWVTENGKQERHLVATVGKFSVIWNFQQVKNSNHECYRNQEGLKSCYCYKIVLKDESIVDSRFMHEKFATSDSPEAPLVVATPMKVSSFSISNRR